MSLATRVARSETAPPWWDWLPLAVLPALAWWLTAAGPAWGTMFLTTFAAVAGLKWLAWSRFVAGGGKLSTPRALGFLFLWPGMNAEEFAEDRSDETTPAPEAWEWGAAVLTTAAGLGVMLWLAPHYAATSPAVTGALAIGGLLFALLFGAFWLLALAWQAAGVPVRPIMNTPFMADSLADFWGGRWNIAFRDVASATLLRPLASQLGAGGAMWGVFIFSGLLHELPTSLPAQAGFGLPTLYFLLQAAGISVERSAWGRAIGLGRGLLGRVFGAAVLFGPLPLHFHPPFLTRVAAQLAP